MYGQQPHIAAFELRNYAFLKDFVRKNEVPCDWVMTSGVHGLYTEDLVEVASRNIKKLKQLAPGLASVVELVRAAPRSSSDGDPLESLGLTGAKGAVVQKNAASLWPYRLVAWIFEQLLAESTSGDSNSFNLQTGTPVLDIQRFKDSWIIHTPRGQVATPTVVVASNGYISRILPEFTGLIVPVRGQVASLYPGERTGDGALRHTYVFLAAKREGESAMDDYLVQARGGERELIYGGGRVRGVDKGWGTSRDDEVDPVVSNHLRRNLHRVLATPSSRDSSDENKATSQQPEAVDNTKPMPASFEWTGIMGYSADGYPWVGQVPPTLGGGKGLWVCGGYTGHGMPLAALCAKAVVELIGGTKDDAVDLPAEFRVSEERAGRVRARGPIGMESAEELIGYV